MRDDERGLSPEALEDLWVLYRQAEKSKALHLRICDLILSSGEADRREWIQCHEIRSPEKSTDEI
jgi:hypothetical protein